ncbi:MAG: DNA polymerase III subunit chi [Pseudomonadota bacterium]
MTRVEFHVVASGASAARVHYASDWLAALGQHVRAHVLCDGSHAVELLQPLLAQFTHISLLDIDAPPPRPDRDTVLINLSETVPPFFSRYRCAVDIADKHGATVDADRLRYRFYRDRGYPLTLHTVEAEAVA